MGLFKVVWRNLFRRPTRSALTIVGLGVAVTAVVSLVGISDGFVRSYNDLYSKAGIDLVVQKAGGMEQINNVLPEELGRRIEALPGVKDAIGGLMDALEVTPENAYVNVAIVVNGWRPDCPFFERIKVQKGGRKFEPGEERVVMLGEILAQKLGKTVGDKLEMYSLEYDIIAVYHSFSVFENGAALVPLADLQDRRGLHGKVTGYVVRTMNNDDPGLHARLKGEIERLEPDLIVLATADFVDSVNQIRVAQNVAWLTSAIALVIGAIGVLNTMVTTVFERTREIGTLRAIGWRKSRVMAMILTESVFLSLAGGVVGVLGALALTHFLATRPITSGFVDGRIAWAVIFQGFVMALGVGLAGAAYPAWWGAKLMPVEALRRK